MSLIRLLSTGRSLEGLKETTSRYRMRADVFLPKFISPRNPFASPPRQPAVKTAPGETASLFDSHPAAAPAPKAAPAPAPVAAPAPVTAPVAPVVRRAKAAAPVQAPTAAPVVSSAPASPAKAVAAKPRFSILGWVKRLMPLSLLPARKPGARSFGKSRGPHQAVQAELALDRVKVVRNDLTDTDLDLQPSRKAVETSGAGAAVAAMPAWPAQPRKAWERVASRLMGVEHTGTH